MKGFVGNIEKLTEENNDFRRVLYTGHNIQLVLMAIAPGGEIDPRWSGPGRCSCRGRRRH